MATKKEVVKTKVRKMNWQKMITEIIETDKSTKWTYDKLGEYCDTSRSTIGRLMAAPDKGNHLDEPKWSQGMALIELHTAIREQYKQYDYKQKG